MKRPAWMHRWMGTASSLALACSRAGQLAGPAAGPHPVSIEQATWRARAAFDSATRAGDTARMAAVFAEDALLISPGGDSIRGRDAIVRYVAEFLPEAHSAAFSFGREGDAELCRGSARERLAYTAHIAYESRAPDTVSGAVSVFWKRDSAGGVRVAWLAFPGPEMRRRLRRAECPSTEDSVWSAWRIAVTVFPVPAGVATASTRSFERTLRARGWIDECLCGGVYPSLTPISRRTWLLAPGLLALQYRIRRHVMAELLGGRLPSGSIMGAQYYSSRDYAQTRLFYSGMVGGVVIAYEQHGVRLAIGPGLQLARWKLRDSVIPYSSGGYPSHTDYKWTTIPAGVIADVQVHRLLSNRLYLAVQAQVRRFRKVSTPATPRFSSAKLDQGSAFLGVGWGVVF